MTLRVDAPALRIFGSLALCVFALLASCSKHSETFTPETTASIQQVQLGSSEVTFEAYSTGAIEILLPPGNRNKNLKWETLYDNMPGTPPVIVQVPAASSPTTGAPASTRGTKDDDDELPAAPQPPPTVTKKTDGNSTKATFFTWRNDPEGLRYELDRRFNKAMRSILKDKDLKAQLETAGRNFLIDPVLVLGCIAGENTFNVGLVDNVQTLAIVAAKWGAAWALKFKSNKTDLAVLVKRPEFSTCSAQVAAGGSQANYWRCVEKVWNKSFSGKTVDRVYYEAQGFKWAFFNPLGSGYTYGLGQLDPIRALMVTDLVNKYSGFRFLTVDRPKEIYEDIINQNTNVHYIAANVRLMIDTYRTIAKFDISQNPGVIASLYNMGREDEKAEALYSKNLVRLKNKQPELPPRESYYGFYINEKEADLRRIFQNWRL